MGLLRTKENEVEVKAYQEKQEQGDYAVLGRQGRERGSGTAIDRDHLSSNSSTQVTRIGQDGAVRPVSRSQNLSGVSHLCCLEL